MQWDFNSVNILFQTLTLASSLVRNELMHTDIRTGKSKTLRTHRTEEPPIDMVRVSHLKQVRKTNYYIYFIKTTLIPFLKFVA